MPPFDAFFVLACLSQGLSLERMLASCGFTSLVHGGVDMGKVGLLGSTSVAGDKEQTTSEEPKITITITITSTSTSTSNSTVIVLVLVLLLLITCYL